METSEHLDYLRVQSDHLAEIARHVDLTAHVPSCPGWDVGELIRHTGRIYRWAHGVIVLQAMGPTDWRDTAGPMPDDRALPEWLLENRDRLIDAIKTADPQKDFWHFGPAPSAVAFWARRQALETTMHRIDAELAFGTPTPTPTPLAEEGLRELFEVFVLPRTTMRSPTPFTLRWEPSDTLNRWTLEVATDRATLLEDAETANCTVKGTASELYELAWNRREYERMVVSGDAAHLAFWRETLKVRMSGD